VFVKRFAALLTLVVAGFATLSRAADGSSLKLPRGAEVAIVLFEDMQCPDCARAYPVVREAANAHGVPLVLYEFPLRHHDWAFEAAVYAKFFDAKSEKLGDQFRAYVFLNQVSITPDGLRTAAEKFAHDHETELPPSVDTDGNFKRKIEADYELGQHIGLQYTPTLFVIRKGAVSTDFVEVTDRSKLNRIIEYMLQKASPLPPIKKASLTYRSIHGANR
jgi:protein-disulfide isomerase